MSRIPEAAGSMELIKSMISRTAAGTDGSTVPVQRGGGGGGKIGVACRLSGAGDGESGGDSGCKGGLEPGLKEKEKELSRERHSSTFRHGARRVKGIIPSTLHPAKFRSLSKAMYHAGLKHAMKCS